MRAGDLDDGRTVYRYPAGSSVVHLERDCASGAGNDCRELDAGSVDPDTRVCLHCTPGWRPQHFGEQESSSELRRALRRADPEDPDWEELADLA